MGREGIVAGTARDLRLTGGRREYGFVIMKWWREAAVAARRRATYRGATQIRTPPWRNSRLPDECENNIETLSKNLADRMLAPKNAGGIGRAQKQMGSAFD